MNDDVLTFGVEEEFFVVDRYGHLSPAGDSVVEAADEEQGELQQELTRSQAESATGVCTTHDEAERQLTTLRAELAQGAARRGCRLLPSGSAPLAETALPAITPNPRYERMSEHFGATARTSHTCGCHVHIAIPDRETGIRVINHVRPFLPALLTMTANSAICDGYDTGYASWRYQQWNRWPSAGSPPLFTSLDHYESIVDAWLRAGAILDRAMVYWDVRLSEKQPTVEFRLGDVAATAGEAVLFGVLIRGLVGTILASEERPSDLSNEVLRAQIWRASREGLSGRCPHFRTGDLAPASDVLDDVVTFAAGALKETGDLDFVRDGCAKLVAEGSGADRQRARFAKRECAEDVVDLLAVRPREG
ncbi:carboxylate-amine ligase [Amycolatopsis decaplanina]|uniref:Putative glutamate--cysteine ligase 2 n=1 Tax=Amycolatopsis decaplanina DSM 44594 TaxID=1284240 RepID=M2ZIW3_9PSEU|nr:glutamate--cysteine ligase [Amycolatopsis decaplanina]EME60863.1 carboxylate-amine ligase [Amycolatopsis decaplanina DSM 44594]